MGRQEVLHRRQADIDHILLSTGRGRGSSDDVPRLLREAGIDPAELGIRGVDADRDAARIAKLRNMAKNRSQGPPAGIVEAAQEAARLARVVRETEQRLAQAREELEAAQRRLVAESDKLL